MIQETFLEDTPCIEGSPGWSMLLHVASDTSILLYRQGQLFPDVDLITDLGADGREGATPCFRYQEPSQLASW